ncbi:beta-N-acetylhexosaminidase [Herbiconiux sp. CPCC 203407]|uniref:Beta-N-acetylhexosaminidase n=1 Tax=Herbiconiux oxytropis TaxID=2970915 RepID=A0AA41XEJ4_9MICO|nr:beta-N-acetylhexosaminidase [Herbiconiux oxytropis]MCS5721133.1 beta-N-acetylhexosaminidase [Herbiconiux oxytropis]MCS5724785.1 beta-N-acetylhexosaminidase [Herbiconiux oxytropis]
MTGDTRAVVLGTLLPGFEGTTLPAWVERMLREGLAGVCLFGENIVDDAQLRALTAAITAANPLALIAIDEEGGDVTRLYYDRGSPFPGNAILGRIDEEETTRRVAVAVGRELRRAGINLDFAPDVDVNSNPLNPVIGIRSFGADPVLVARHAAAWTQGLQSTGVAASIKHFPGHGDTAEDSHLALPSIAADTDELRRRELLPFRDAIRAGALTVMTSHILVRSIDPSSPATFSSPILQGILREELGFTGVVVSDALDMAGASGDIGIPAAAVRALAAGCDLLCIGTKNTEAQLEEIAELVAAEVDPARLDDAASRVRSLAAGLATEPVRAADAELPGSDRIAEAFAISPEADSALEGPGWVVLRVDAEPNVAIGEVPWGPFRAWARSGSPAPVVSVSEVDSGEAAARIPPEASVLVIGRDNQRRPAVRSLIDALSNRHERVVAIDMGWPGDDPVYAGVATYGASDAVGEALVAMLNARGVRA